MFHKFLSFIILALSVVLFWYISVDAALLPGGSASIANESISINAPGGSDVMEISRSFGFKVLIGLKLVVSGFALIYIVMIGAYMIVFSESEDRIKSQKNQLTYTLVGFLFLNIPGLVYTVFFWSSDPSSVNIGKSIGGGWDVEFWDSSTLTGLNGIIPMFIGFFEIFIFGVAIVMFTWWFFRLILSGGDEEIQKKAKNRIIYGILGLIFLWFVRFWSSVISKGDFFGEFATIGNKFVWLALYFAAPIVIGFLVVWSYYYITSAGDEERTKKAKAIFINTLIASLILLWAYSFLGDLASFTL